MFKLELFIVSTRNGICLVKGLFGKLQQLSWTWLNLDQLERLTKVIVLHRCLVIVGNDRAGVISARTRIDVLVTSARRRHSFTHFISLPVVSDVVREKFDIFKEEVLQGCAGVSLLCWQCICCTL